MTQKPVGYATISLLRKSDSSLVSFTLSDSSGKFTLQNIAQGNYRLLITRLSYLNKNIFLNTKINESLVDFGKIQVNVLSAILNSVTINEEAPPVTLKDDTIEYNAGSFKTPPNSDVESLLKKLPGVQVDKDGNITANGQKVNHVYVDGKEFFSSDPKIATKNLPADAVNKVQVFDKQSDISQLTGFDDGDSEKAINLTLKKDKRKGVFGKINAGAGTDGRYAGQFNVNDFNDERQLSAIGMANNTNSEGFSFMDILNFTGGLKNMMQGGGEIRVNLNDQNNPVAAANEGVNNNSINTVWAGGLNYANTLSKKLDLGVNYFYSRYSPLTESYIHRQYFLPDSTYYYNQNARINNQNDNHRINLIATWKPDSMRTVKFTPSFTLQNSSANSMNSYSTLTQDLQTANKGNSNIISSADGYNFSNDVLFTQKFNRKGRSFLIDLNTTASDNTNSAILQSRNNFFDNSGNVIQSDTINQKSNTLVNSFGYSLRGVYTEPVFRHSLVEFSAQYSNSENTSKKVTDNFNPFTNEYDDENSFLTNDYTSHYDYGNAGLRFRTQRKKYSFSVGALLQQSTLNGAETENGIDSAINKKFVNLLPNARFEYRFNQFRNLTVQYNASTSPPSVTQLQPVPDNSNPLLITVGNPGLKPGFTNSVRLNFLSSNPFASTSLFTFVDFSETQNSIVNYNTTDSLGITHTRPVNANGIYDLSATISESFPTHILKSTVELNADLDLGRNKAFINSEENSIHSITATPSIRLLTYPSSKTELDLSASFTYNQSAYSLQSAMNTQYYTQEYGGEFDWTLPASFFFTTNFGYSINTGRGAGFDNAVPLWNATFSKLFLRFNRGEVKFSVYDLLNSNIGTSRTSNQDYIEDIRSQTVTRYFMLSFTFSLTKMSAEQPKEGGIHIIRR